MRKYVLLSKFLLFVLVMFALSGCQSEANENVAEEPLLSSEVSVGKETTQETDEQQQGEVKPNQPDDEEIIEMVIQAHRVALEIFFSAFEDGFLGIDSVPFDKVRPILIKHYSEHLVDTEFKKFYEEDLWAWGYEMHFAFPFFDRENIIDLAVGNRDETRIEVHGTAYVNYEEYGTSIHGFIYENDRWVLDY